MAQVFCHASLNKFLLAAVRLTHAISLVNKEAFPIVEQSPSHVYGLHIDAS